MTNEERHIAVLNRMLESMDVYDSIQPTTERKKAIKAAIKALSQEPTDTWSIKDVADTFKKHGLIRDQEPCDDVISRKDIQDYIAKYLSQYLYEDVRQAVEAIDTYIGDMPSVTQKSGHCKECKYFEYDSVAKVDGIPLIVAHEICNKWGNGCKTSEDGYCYLFEPQESEKV